MQTNPEETNDSGEVGRLSYSNLFLNEMCARARHRVSAESQRMKKSALTGQLNRME